MARRIKRMNVRETLLTFEVGETLDVLNTESKYVTCYQIAKNLEKERGWKFEVTTKGIVDGCKITRLD